MKNRNLKRHIFKLALLCLNIIFLSSAFAHEKKLNKKPQLSQKKQKIRRIYIEGYITQAANGQYVFKRARGVIEPSVALQFLNASARKYTCVSNDPKLIEPCSLQTFSVIPKYLAAKKTVEYSAAFTVTHGEYQNREAFLAVFAK